MGEWIIRAQKTYTDARITACEITHSRKLKGTVFPEPAIGFGKHTSGGPFAADLGEVPALVNRNEGEADCAASPILGMLRSLFR
jgi:hypothetical protein